MPKYHVLYKKRRDSFTIRYRDSILWKYRDSDYFHYRPVLVTTIEVNSISCLHAFSQIGTKMHPILTKYSTPIVGLIHTDFVHHI